MSERLFKACENPCPTCPKQNRIRAKAVAAEVRANHHAGMMELDATARDAALDAAMRMSALITDEGDTARIWIEGVAERTGTEAPTYEVAQAHDKNVRESDQKLGAELDTLRELEAQSEAYASTCEGASTRYLGPIAVSRCTSESVSRFGGISIDIMI